MKKNFLITTGGSGGHVIPATILYEHLSNHSNLIITTDTRGLKFLTEGTYKIRIIDTPKLNNFFLLPLNLIKILFLIIKSYFILKKFKIDTVISTGGYMSLPIIIAAKFYKLEIFLVEPNLVLGRANRFFLKSCKKILCYTDQLKNFPENFKKKIFIINPLVKKKIYSLDLDTKTEKKFVILVVGGSQGASIFDNNLKEIIVNISKNFPIKIIQQTHKNNIQNLKNFYERSNIESEIFSFEKNFFNIIQKANLCITRSGASTLAELSVLQVPFVAVPLPTSKDNHQFENAEHYRTRNCCWVINQNNFENKIGDLLTHILKKKNDYFEKKENLKRLNYQNTWINVNQKIIGILNEN